MNGNANYLIPTCHIAGHSLARRGGQWIDVATCRMHQAPRVPVLIDSIEFFHLARQFPGLSVLRSLGGSFQLALGGKIYEVFREDAAGKNRVPGPF